jgi:hypothetical protein
MISSAAQRIVATAISLKDFAPCGLGLSSIPTSTLLHFQMVSTRRGAAPSKVERACFQMRCAHALLDMKVLKLILLTGRDRRQ